MSRGTQQTNKVKELGWMLTLAIVALPSSLYLTGIKANLLPEEWIGLLADVNPIVNYVGHSLYIVVAALLLSLLNKKMALIRTRPAMLVSFFLLFIACIPGSLFQSGSSIILCVVSLSMLFLIDKYKTSRPEGSLFTAFLFLGCVAMIQPRLTGLILIWIIGAVSFQILTLRSLMASIAGFFMPLWLTMGTAFGLGKGEHIVQLLEQTLILDTKAPSTWIEWTPFGLLTLFFLIATAYYFTSEYEDKIRTRSLMRFFVVYGFVLIFWIIISPKMHNWILPLFIPVLVILYTRMWNLISRYANNKWRILFLLLPIIAVLTNLWMHS